MSTTKLLAVPTVHLNGTSAEVLKNNLRAVTSALMAALFALEAAAPNARDYYPQGEWAYPIARKAHEEQCAKLREMQVHYYLQLEALEDAIDARKK